MHNDDKKRMVRLALAIGLLLSGVVCGAAVINKVSAPERSGQENKDTASSLLTFDKVSETDKAAQTESTSLNNALLPEDISEDAPSSAGYKIVSRTVKDALRQGRPTYALKLLETDPLAKKLKNAEFDRIKAQIAQSYLMEGVEDKAARVAGQAVHRSGKYVPLAGWVAGMTAWRQADYKKAKDMFGTVAKSPNASAWLASAGAYWAARAATRSGKTDEAEEWHKKAARYTHTFYGLVSLRTLGQNFDFNWSAPELARADKKSLEADLKVSAAMRLSRDGELSAAITTLGSTRWMRTDGGRRSLLAYFQMKKEPALTLYLARRTRDENGKFYDTALYPESPWEPKNGYEVDKALIHALIRQESRFNPHAVSRTGAQGLMQIMPATAQYVAKDIKQPLSHPETNIEVGQKYVKHLLNDRAVNNDLFNMAVAYNAGPGNLSRWKKNLNTNDPMLFIESIPSGETRAFVERVMVNYWIYRMRLGQDVPSLDVVATLDAPDVATRAATRPISDTVAWAE